MRDKELFGGASGMLLFDGSKNEFVKKLEMNSASEIFALVAQLNPRYNDDAFFILHIDNKGDMIPSYANNGVLSGGGSPVSFSFDSNNGVFILNRSETNRGWRIWNYRYQ